VYCPKCRAEYREGFSKCSDCQIPLVAEKPAAPKGPGDPELELVTVLESSDPLMITAAKDLLEEGCIPFYVFGEEVAPRIAMVGAYSHPWCRVQVGCDREMEARALLQALKGVI
jgi:hypothetical protein